MPEKYKLGLSRNRLFEFDNCVSVFCEFEEKVELLQCEKALKMLCLKEPLITSCVELEADGEATVVVGKNVPVLEIATGDWQELLETKKNQGIDFSEKLFSFAILNENTFCVFAHTVIADVHSLMYLASQFKSFYGKKAFSVVPCENKVISLASQLPSNVYSVVIDRLASGLELGWQKKTAVFTCENYKRARDKYFETKASVGRISFTLDDKDMESLGTVSEKEHIDVSSLVAFAFYESLCENIGGKRKYRKLNVQSNERIFFDDFECMNVGAYNGFFSVEKNKNKKIPDTLVSNAKCFHKEIYKRATSSFNVFYNEFLFMRLPPSFADSQYMCCAGEFKHKYSKKLANTYGCANEVFGEFCSYNTAQDYWLGLKGFNNINVSEPLKMRSSSLITFVQEREKGRITFEYKKNKIPDEIAEKIIKKAKGILNEIK